MGLAGPDATPKYTYGICQSTVGDFYLTFGSMILKCDGDTLKVEVLAGSSSVGRQDGGLLEATFDTPLGLMWHEEKLWVVQSHSIRQIYADRVQTLVGSTTGHVDGDFAVVKFNNPTHLTELNGLYYMTDSFNHCIRVIDVAQKKVSSIGYGPKSPINGDFTKAGFKYPRGICTSLDGHILVVESGGSAIRQIDLEQKIVTDYPASFGKDFRFALGVMHTSTDEIFVTDTASEHIIYLTPSRHVVRLIGHETVKNECEMKNASTHRPTATLVTPNGDLFWSEELGKLRYVRGMFPPKHKLVLDYSSMLTEESPLSDLTLLHASSGHSFRLHRGLLQLLQIYDISPLATCEASADQCERFLSFLYGAMDLHTPVASAEDLAWMVALAALCKIPIDLYSWLKLQFTRTLQNLPHTAFSAIVSVVLGSKSLSQTPSLRLSLSNEAGKRAASSSVPMALDEALSADLANTSISVDDTRDTHDLPRNFHPKVWLQEQLLKLCKDFQLVRVPIPSEDHEATNAPQKAAVVASNKDTGAGVASTNFTFALEGSDDGSGKVLGLHIHDWVLSTRWPYFKRMLASGFGESQSRCAFLPSGFPSSLLVPFMKFVYSGTIDTDSLLPGDCKYLIENGGEFGVIDIEGDAPPNFDALVRHCRTKL